MSALRIALVASLAAAGAASAHHSQAAYDQSADVVIEGTVAELAWKNPHVYLTLDVVGADGAHREQQVEVVSVPAALSLGLTPDVMPIGEQVAVRAHPNRAGPGRSVFGLDITTSDGSIYPLSTQGRSTHRPDAAVPADSIAGRWAPVHDPLLVPTVRGWPYSQLGRAALAAPEIAGGAPASTVGCTLQPPPMLTLLPEARTIEVGADVVAFRFEANGVEGVRTVRLDLAEHPADLEPSLLGHAIGWWEGETLVIDTVGFAPHRVGLGFGAPSGSGKHLVERLTLIEDRLHLRYELTVEDPEYLTAPGTYAVLWAHRPDLAAAEACDPDVALRYLQE